MPRGRGRACLSARLARQVIATTPAGTSTRSTSSSAQRGARRLPPLSPVTSPLCNGEDGNRIVHSALLWCCDLNSASRTDCSGRNLNRASERVFEDAAAPVGDIWKETQIIDALRGAADCRRRSKSAAQHPHCWRPVTG